jgi:hypothetical protein
MTLTITLTEADLLRLQIITVDADGADALAFVRERVLPQVKAQQGKTMISHLDGGKGSLL